MHNNVLVYSSVPLWKVHHVETVELILSHHHNGDMVHLMSCRGDLYSCPANPFNKPNLCMLCIKQQEYTFQNIFQFLSTNQVFTKNELTQNEFIPTFRNIKEFRDFEIFSVPFGELALSQIVDDTNEIDVPLSLINQRGVEMIKSGVALYKFTKNLIQDLNISLVYAWNGRRISDGPVLYAAKDSGVKFFAHISGCKPGKMVIVPSTKIHDEKHQIIEMNRIYNNKQAKHIHFDLLSYARNEVSGEANSEVKILGHVDFSKQFKSTYKDFVHRKDKRIISFFISSDFEFAYMKDYESKVPTCFQNPFDILKFLNSSLEILTYYNIVIRWHPNLVNAGQTYARNINKIIKSTPNLIHFRPESSVDSHELLLDSDKIIINGSTLGAVAALYEIPVIDISFSKIYRSFTFTPRNITEFKRFIVEKLPTPNSFAAAKYIYYQRNFGNYDLKFTQFKGLEPYYRLTKRSITRRISIIKKIIYRILYLFKSK